MTIADAQPRSTPSVRSGSRTLVLVAALLAAANLLGLLLNILGVLDHYDRHATTDYVVVQDVWGPFILVAWAQAVVNGVVLVVWKRSRPAGLGVLLGAVAAAVLFVGWMVFVVLPGLGS